MHPQVLFALCETLLVLQSLLLLSLLLFEESGWFWKVHLFEKMVLERWFFIFLSSSFSKDGKMVLSFAQVSIYFLHRLVLKKFIFLKRAPGSTSVANTNDNTTQTVIRMKRPFKINLNRLSCSICVNSIG